MINKVRFNKGFIWKSSICESECKQSCDIGEYLFYKNCKGIKELINKLVEEFSEYIDENEMIYNATLKDYGKVCNSCTIYIVFLAIFFINNISISSAFIYLNWYLKK